MWIRHLCGHIESEVFFIIIVDLVTYTDLPNTSLCFVGLLLENGVKTWIKEFFNVFNQDRFSTGASLPKSSLQIRS